MNVKHTEQAGFTLLEIAIVMVIFGLIVGGLIGPMSLQMENLDRKETESTIDQAIDTIIVYAIRNGRLPCPDTDNDGQENTTGSNCSNARGQLPWVTLGVNRIDAWAQPFTYRVDPQFSDTTDGTGCPDADVPGVSFEICSTGNINILDANGGNLVAAGVPAVIVSHGRNGPGATDNHERENTDNDTNFVDRSHINGGYDDHVGWVNVNALIGKMINAQKLP